MYINSKSLVLDSITLAVIRLVVWLSLMQLSVNYLFIFSDSEATLRALVEICRKSLYLMAHLGTLKSSEAYLVMSWRMSFQRRAMFSPLDFVYRLHCSKWIIFYYLSSIFVCKRLCPYNTRSQC